MKTRSNIILIIKESYRWRNRNLIENSGFIEPCLTLRIFINSNALITIISLIISLLIYNYIDKDFAGYVIGALSIFVGLFTTVLILVFDKYYTQSKFFENNNILNDTISLEQKKLKNFSRKFIFVSLESLLIATSLIALLFFPLLIKDQYLKNIFAYDFLDSYKDLTINSIVVFIINFVSIITRTMIIILLYKFLKYLYYIFGSLGSYLLGIFNNHVRI